MQIKALGAVALLLMSTSALAAPAPYPAAPIMAPSTTSSSTSGSSKTTSTPTPSSTSTSATTTGTTTSVTSSSSKPTSTSTSRPPLIKDHRKPGAIRGGFDTRSRYESARQKYQQELSQKVTNDEKKALQTIEDEIKKLQEEVKKLESDIGKNNEAKKKEHEAKQAELNKARVRYIEKVRELLGKHKLSMDIAPIHRGGGWKGEYEKEKAKWEAALRGKHDQWNKEKSDWEKKNAGKKWADEVVRWEAEWKKTHKHRTPGRVWWDEFENAKKGWLNGKSKWEQEPANKGKSFADEFARRKKDYVTKWPRPSQGKKGGMKGSGEKKVNRRRNNNEVKPDWNKGVN